MSASADNRVLLLGNLGQDVELRELAQGNKLARVSLATGDFRRNQDGQVEKITTWHNLVAWGQVAQEMNELLQKGQRVFVEGKLVYRQFETRTGEKRSQTEIVVNSFKKMTKDEAVPV